MALIDPIKQQPKAADLFVKLDEDKPVTIQLLQERAAQYFVYWFKDSSQSWVKYISPGLDSCPIVERNRIVGKDNPKYIKASRKYAIMVYDTTPKIVCTACGADYWPQDKVKDCECGQSLAGIKKVPVNKVRILERGYRLFSQLNSLEGTVTDADGDELSVISYPIMIIRKGTGNETTTTPVPQLHLPAVDPSDFEEDFIELPYDSLQLTRDEVMAILNDNVPLSDIFEARKGTDNDEAEKPGLF